MALLLVEYIAAAMRHAEYDRLADDGTFVGTIPGFAGVWANAATIGACRDELAEVLEGWLLLGISRHETLPVVDGCDVNVGRAVEFSTADMA